MSYRRYSLVLLALVLTMMAAVGLFSRLVDPFWYFRDVDKPGFNLDKPRFPRNERLVKSALVVKLRPQAVIMGSSYAEVGLPATHPGFTDDGRLKPYNLAVSGGSWPEVYCYAKFALSQPGIKRLVLGASGTGDEPCDKYEHLGSVDYSKLLFSHNALSASWETVRRQDGKPRVSAEGMWYFKRYDAKIRNDEDVMKNFVDEMRGRICRPLQVERPLDAQRIARTPPKTDPSTAGLRNVIRLALRNNVELVLIYYPKHVLQYELERRCDRLEGRWSELWNLASIVEEETAGTEGRVSLWDFYGYRAINSERIRAGIPMAQRLWQDAGHFNHEVGAAAFDTVFGKGGSYGRRVTTADFDRAVAAGERERSAFIADHPWVRQELDELLRRAGAAPP